MNYKRTTVSCMAAIFVQAIVTNVVAILFTPMMSLYGLTYVDLGILVSVNFFAQVGADVIFSGTIDKIGFKKLIFPASALSCIGLVMLGCTPWLFPNHIFIGLMVATLIFAFSSGLSEVLLSPMIDAIPSDDSAMAMSLMHSFYAWGQVATIIVTTLFVFVFGGKYWQIIVFIWAIIPFVNFFMFMASPIPDVIPEDKRQNAKEILRKSFYILALAAIFCGAGTEITLNQWSSTFMEKGLGLTKVAGDLIGMCGFAVMLGMGRLLYGKFGNKFDMSRVLIFGSALSLLCYITVALSPSPLINVAACILCGFGASLLWPGVIVLSAEHFPMAGAWMFAILAMAGDIGGSFSSWLTGTVVDRTLTSDFAAQLAAFIGSTPEQAAIRTGILFASIFPLCALIIHIIIKKKRIKPDWRKEY